MAYVEHILTGTSPSSQTTGTSNTVESLESFDWFTINAKLTGATGGALDVYVQRFVGALNEWQDWLVFPQLAAAAATVRYVADSRMQSLLVTSVGAGTSPVIVAGANGLLVCSHPGKKARLLFSAGASTSAGAVQTVSLGCWRAR